MESGNYANAEEYLAALSGWQLECVRGLRDSVLAAARFDEFIKWGHLVYEHNGPVLLNDQLGDPRDAAKR